MKRETVMGIATMIRKETEETDDAERGYNGKRHVKEKDDHIEDITGRNIIHK